MNFRVGQKVVCIAPGFRFRRRWLRLLDLFKGGSDPVRGGVYEVTGCGFIDKPYLLLRGFRLAYSANSFRPLVETSLNHLAEIAKWPDAPLVPATEGPVRAPAREAPLRAPVDGARDEPWWWADVGQGMQNADCAASSGL